MATVWRARDDVLARAVAVKILHPELAGDQSFLMRFRTEALSAARLSHPHIVAIYDSGVEEDPEGAIRHYIVMEHCGGGSLATRLLSSGPLPPDRAIAVACSICDALAYAHRTGVIHRDIKPANVLINDDGTLKVADFGIAKAAFAEGEVTTTGTLLGTMSYVAPEQVVGAEPDERSDIYSLGVLTYELLAGRPPFSGEGPLAIALKQQREDPPPLRSIRVGIPRRLESAVMTALEKDPAKRYSSADELREALEGRSRGAAPTAVFEMPRRPTPEPPAPVPTRGPRSESRKLVPLLVFVVVAVGIALALPSLLGRLSDRNRGPAQAGGESSPAGGGPVALRPASASDFDPFGGDGEHPQEAPLAIDGNDSTAWETSTYSDPLQAVKPGVGLLVDLGRPRRVGGATIVSTTPGYSFQLRAGASDGALSDLSAVQAVGSAPGRADLGFSAVTARYWLVWITSLPGGGGGSASIDEVKLLGP